MKILTTAVSEASEVIKNNEFTELAINGSKVLEFDVEIMKCSRPTRNGRIYHKDDMEVAVNHHRIQDLLARGCFYGEGEHPEDPTDLERWVGIPVDRRQFKWTKLWFEGDILMGRVQTFPGNGNLLFHSIASGELPAFSVRCIGKEQPEGNFKRLTDILLLYIDWVNHPGGETSHVKSTSDFTMKDVPLFNYQMNTPNAYLPRSEAHVVLGLSENESLISLGSGYYASVETLNEEKRNMISKIRSRAF